jgi:type II secretory pathway pseudopilin PulG
MTLVIAVCALVGAIAGIAGSAAAPSKSKSAQAAKRSAAVQARKMHRAFQRGMRPGFGFRAGPGPGFFGGPVHADAVIPKRDGSGFLTITTDAGTLNSVDGTTVHLKEGTDEATYKDDVGIDVGSDATVIRDHKKASLSDLKAGDHVRVIQGTPKGTIVMAEDDAFMKQEQKEHGAWGPPEGPPPPPPGAPGAAPGDGGSNQNGSTTTQSGSPANS